MRSIEVVVTEHTPRINVLPSSKSSVISLTSDSLLTTDSMITGPSSMAVAAELVPWVDCRAPMFEVFLCCCFVFDSLEICELGRRTLVIRDKAVRIGGFASNEHARFDPPEKVRVFVTVSTS